MPPEQKVFNKIRLSRSIVGIKEAAALRRVIIKDGFLGMGQDVAYFEKELTDFIGGDIEVSCVNSGTAALHLAVMAVVKSGDEVLVPGLTFLATFQAITAAGAVAVACDIDPKTLLLDLKDAQKRLTPRTKALMLVHYSGGVGDLKAFYAFAKKHGLRIIEDAAHAFGTVYDGKRIGSCGDIICFSFDGIKNITSGEGGAVVTRDRQVAQFVKDARMLGIHKDSEKRFQGQRSWEFEVTHQGYRYHLSNLLAAIGRVQLQRFPVFCQRRRKIARRYMRLLGDCPGVELIDRDYETVVPHIFPVLIKAAKRDALRDYMLQLGIETGIHYYPSHWLDFFGGRSVSLPVLEKVYKEILSLPIHPGISSEDQTRVSVAIYNFMSENK